MDELEFFREFSPDLDPIRRLAEELDNNPKFFRGALAFSHRPNIGTEAYAVRLYPPLPSAIISRYEERFHLEIPGAYRAVLERLNGLHAFEFALFGIPPSMAVDPPLLDRSSFSPFDLDMANRSWKHEYKIGEDSFHFGSGPYSHDELIGYFWDLSGVIHSYRKNGERVRSWTTFADFLRDELKRAESEYPRFESFMSSLQTHTPKRRSRKKSAE